MDPLIIALIVAVFTLLVLFSGIPIAFGLSFVSIVLLVSFEGFQMLDVFAETFFAGLNSFVLLSIPMFILMGMAVANSPAGKDLYTGLDRWLWRVPGGLVISNIGACSIFAALSGSSPATCAAIGTMGIPEMRKRGYSDQIATGTIAAGGTLGVLIPPSIVLIVYGIATGTSIGRLFLSGLIPGFMLAGMFAIWALIHSYFIDKDSAKALKNRTACLIANHGQVAFGENLEKTFELAQEIENICHQYINAIRIGIPKILSKKEMKIVLGKFKNYKKG